MSEKSIVINTELPGPKSREWLERRRKVVCNGVSIGKLPIFADFAKGALLTDIDGNTFIDFGGGIGCINAGHSPQKVIDAVIEQTQKLQHTCFQVTMYKSYIKLAEKLVEITPGKFDKKVALFNSGAESVENAIKIARKYTNRQSVICFENAFHGRTLMTLSLTSKVNPYKNGFGPFAPEVYQAQLPYVFRKPAQLTEEEYIDQCIANFHGFLSRTVAPDQLAAIIIEPVLGEGGFIVPPARFLQEIQKVCNQNGIVFIADEIQSGFARTGKMFASEHFDIQPDLITLAKSMSNGFPVSAVVGKAEIMDAAQPGGIGGTFGGNPVSCAAALASIETIEQENLCAKSENIGNIVKNKLNSLKDQVTCIGDVRGLGAMIGIEICKESIMPDKETADKIVMNCAHKGLLILTSGVEGNIIRTLMPLSITESQLNEALDILESVIREI